VPDTNRGIGVTSKEGVTISTPCQRDGFGLATVRGSEESFIVGVQLGDLFLAFKIPNLNAVRSGSTQPIAIGRESQGMDDASSIKSIQRLVLDQIPEIGNLVTAARGTEGTVGRDGDGVQITLMSFQILDQLAVSQAPDLNKFVPSARDDDGVVVAGREFDAAGPKGVVSLRDCELALSEGVPQADGSVSRGRDDLSVIGGEGDAEDFFGMALEAASGSSGLEIPQAEAVIPRSRESEESIGRDDDILNEVSMTNQRFARISVVSVFVSQVPNDKSLISCSGDQKIRVFGGGCDGSHPTSVSSQDTSKVENLGVRSHWERGKRGKGKKEE